LATVLGDCVAIYPATVGQRPQRFLKSRAALAMEVQQFVKLCLALCICVVSGMAFTTLRFEQICEVGSGSTSK
jgi:hypothetical protein